MSEHTHEQFVHAWNRGDDLRRWYGKAQGAKDRAEIADELALLVHGTHPHHPGIKLSLLEFDINDWRGWPTCDAARPFRAPTRDVGIFFRRPTRDEEPDEQWDDDGEAVEMIMSELKSLATRCDALDKLPMFRAATKGPAVTPRTLNPQQAYQAHLTAYQMNQARASQRKAHEMMPDVVPQHPDDAATEAREQQDATRDAPLPTHDFNASAYGRSIHTHKMIARPSHLTFADRKTINSNLKQNLEPRAMRDHEATLAADMAKQIKEFYGEDR
jgi:hypothetical protein